jgi:predicted dehydrogenase
MKPPLDRRSFLKHSAVAAAGFAALGHRALAASRGANDKIVLGLIGCGNMGRANMRNLLELPGTEVAAVCDVDAHHAQEAVADVLKRQSRTPEVYKDFRHLLDRKDIDAVIIGTPDHWHAIPFIAACEAGKDIYCEKPISHSFVEAKAMLAAARRFKPVVQVGTWQRSLPHFQQAIEFVRSGKMGKIQLCRAWATFNIRKVGRQQPVPVPAELDWDFWLGPAPCRPYQPNRCHSTWRWFFETGGGLTTDWGVHMIDIVLLGMNDTDPRSVHSEGGIFVTDDDRDTPDTMQTLYRFPKWQLSWEQRVGNNRGLDGGLDHGSEFIGEKGALIVDRSAVRWFPKEGDDGDGSEPEDPGPGKTIHGGNPHWKNFLDCIRTRQRPRSDIESMAKTTMICHLANISWQAQSTIQWDAKEQDVANRSAARRAISYEREYRKPWKLKVYKG